jgi:hypothetical protein
LDEGSEGLIGADLIRPLLDQIRPTQRKMRSPEGMRSRRNRGLDAHLTRSHHQASDG